LCSAAYDDFVKLIVPCLLVVAIAHADNSLPTPGAGCEARLKAMRAALPAGGQLHSVRMGSRAVMSFRHQALGPLAAVLFAIDGTVVYEHCAPDQAIDFFDGGLVPGAHTLQVILDLGDRLVQSARPFRAVEGELVRVVVTSAGSAAAAHVSYRVRRVDQR
jgi:hypothetical protein